MATTTSTSSSEEVAESFIRSPKSGAGLVQTGGVDQHHLGIGAVEHPRTWARVVLGRGEVMVTLVPTMALTSVDFPTLGRPTTAAEPRPEGGHSGWSARPASATGTIRTRSIRRPSTRSATSRSPSTVDRLTGHRHVAQQVEHQPADRVPGAGGKVGIDQLVDLVDRQTGTDPQLAGAQLLHRGLLDVELVDDLPDQLLDEVLQGDQAGRAAVLVDHHGHVEGLRLHLPHHGRHPFGLGDEVGDPEVGPDRVAAPCPIAPCGSCPWCRRSPPRRRPGARPPASG